MRNGTEMVTASPAELLKDVTEGTFIRCHQSYSVNYEHIILIQTLSDKPSASPHL